MCYEFVTPPPLLSPQPTNNYGVQAVFTILELRMEYSKGIGVNLENVNIKTIRKLRCSFSLR